MTKDLTHGGPARLILFFTLPLIAGNIFQQLYAFVDTLLVGRFLGVNALAAVGCTGSIMFFMMGFVVGFSTGITIYTGQRYGAKDERGVRQSAAACLVLTLLESAVLTVIGLSGCRWLLIVMQTPAEILDGAYAFISIILGGVIMFAALQTLTNIIRALGDSRMPTIFLATALMVNVILEPIAILVLEWGIPGAALATIASQFIGDLLCVIYIKKRVPALHIHREDWHVSREFLLAHLKIGLPMGFQTSIIALGAIILQVALNDLGPVAVAAYAASQKIESLAMMPMMSFGFAMAAYTAQNYGARKYHRIIEGVRKACAMSVAFSITAGILLILFGPKLMYLFVGPGQDQVIAYGHEYLIVNGSCYWILSFLFVYRFTLQGLGQSVVPTIAGVMELIMRTLAALFLCGWLGYLGACLANPMAWIGSCVPLAIAYWWTKRILKRDASSFAGQS